MGFEPLDVEAALAAEFGDEDDDLLGDEDDDLLGDEDDDLLGDEDDDLLGDEDDDLLGDDDLPEDDDDLLEPGGEDGAVSSPPRKLPIMSPVHNMRELCKQLVLLEDHLFQPPKHCPDCVRKHLLTAEALAEEAITLDKSGEHRDLLAGLPEKIRDMQRGVLAGDSIDHKRSVAQRARAVRKKLSGACFGLVAEQGGESPSMGEANAEGRSESSEYERRILAATKVEPEDVGDEPMTIERAQDIAAGYLLRGHRYFLARKAGAPEGERDWWDNAAKQSLSEMRVVSNNYKPGKMIEVWRMKGGSPTWIEVEATPSTIVESVASKLAQWTPFDVSKEPRQRHTNVLAEGAMKLAGAMRRASVDKDWSPSSLPAPEPGAPVICFSHDQWWRGTVADMGVSCGGKTVRSITRSSVPVIWEENGQCFLITSMDRYVRVVPGDAAISRLLGAADFQGLIMFRGDREDAPQRLSEQQLLMADVIQAVLKAKLASAGRAVGIDDDTWSLILDRIVWAAVVNAWYESKLDPKASGDAGKSVGLFQLRSPGLGSGMTVAQRENPILNTLRVAKEFYNLLRRGEFSVELVGENPDMGASIAEIVQTWTAAWTMKIEKPSNMEAKAKDRGDTAYVMITGNLPPDREQRAVQEQQAQSDAARQLLAQTPVATPAPAGGDFLARGADPVAASAFIQKHAGIKPVKEATFFEQRAALHKKNGDNRRSRSTLDAAVESWQAAGVELRTSWPFSRAAYLCRQMGNVACEYQVLRRFVAVTPAGASHPAIEAARARMAALESEKPRAFLLAPATAEGRRDMIKTGVAAGGIVATTALVAGALWKLATMGAQQG